jgi:Na+-transporting NADH:ubiquinone oxidoreductase subunit NqrF
VETERTAYEELERTAEEVPSFKFMTRISRPRKDAAWKGKTGRVVRKYTGQWVLRPETATAYSMFEKLYFIPGKEAAAKWIS